MRLQLFHLTQRVQGYAGVALVIAASLAVGVTEMAAGQTAKACIRASGFTPWALTGAIQGGAGTGTVQACEPADAWAAAIPYNMEPTTSATKGTIAFVNVASQTLYLGFTVAQDPQFSEKDLIQLLFDVNNNQQIDAGDFYLLIRVGPKLPTPGPLQSGTSCHFAVTGIQAFQNNGTWQPMSITVGTLTGQIEAQAAYDYAGPPDDNEVGAWNVEIRVPLVGAGFSLPNSFGLGAYVYVDFNAGSPNAQTGQVLRCPSTLPPKNMGEDILTFYPVN